MKSIRSNYDAVGEFDPDTKSLTVLKGSIASDTISTSRTFKGGAAIDSSRTGAIKDNKLCKDITFKSASTAANFVTGNSTNGLRAWKNEEGVCLKELLDR